MREFVPAERPEYLSDFEQEPVLGIYDLGEQIQNPMRSAEPGNYEAGYITYRDYRIAAFPPVDFGMQSEAQEDVEPSLPQHPFVITSVGVSYRSDIWELLPANMYRSGHLAGFHPPEADLIEPSEPMSVVKDQNKARELGSACPDVFLREITQPTVLLVGKRAITGFLEGFVDETEAGEPKRMAWRTGDHLLPRVDWDLLSLAVSANIAGVPETDLPLPEEHRFRVLVGIAEVLSSFYVQSRRELEVNRAPEQEFKDYRDYRLNMEMSNPLDLVNRIFHGSYYQFYGTANPDVAYVLRAYGIKPDEMVEATQQLWYGRTYCREEAEKVPLEDLHDHVYRPPDPNKSRLFLDTNSTQDIAYYNEMIRQTVYTAIDPFHKAGDTPHNR